jgi:hypothetical protein
MEALPGAPLERRRHAGLEWDIDIQRARPDLLDPALAATEEVGQIAT